MGDGFSVLIRSARFFAFFDAAKVNKIISGLKVDKPIEIIPFGGPDLHAKQQNFVRVEMK